jgi:hypothetical protein
MWLYGAEAQPGNSPGAGSPRHIYDEANVMLNSTVLAGSTIRLQKDGANSSQYAIDFISLEQVSPIGNPDPSTYVVPTGFGHQDVQNALDQARMTAGKVGVYLPAGEYQTANKFQVYGKAVRVVGADPWYTRFDAPANQENTDVGFNLNNTANGSTFAGFSYFGNYTSRIDGPGKVFDLFNMSNVTIDDVWVEHQMCMLWGMNISNLTLKKNSRMRNLYADGLNMTYGSTNNLISNNEARVRRRRVRVVLGERQRFGDIEQRQHLREPDLGPHVARGRGSGVRREQQRLPQHVHRRHSDLSGCDDQLARLRDPVHRVRHDADPRRERLDRARRWASLGRPDFPAMWLHSASKEFRGIRVSDVDIIDPTYHGVMFQTKYNGTTPEFPVTDTILTNVSSRGRSKAVTLSTPSLASASGPTSCPNPAKARRSGPRPSPT